MFSFCLPVPPPGTRTRRAGLNRLLVRSALAVCLATCLVPPGWAETVSVVKHPPVGSRNTHYAGPRAPLVSTPLVELPVGTVRPEGWLRKQIELQAAGFHGHLEEISRFLVKQDNAWLNPQGQGRNGWEEVPYWLKGYLLTAYLLEDPAQIREAHVWIEAALASVQPDGWFGPRAAGSTVQSTGKNQLDLWPNMVMLFCLQAYFERTQDPRVLDLMQGYFRFELQIPDEDFLPPYWQQQRGADNLYSVYWLYNRTGEPWLLELATKIHQHTANWTDDVPNWHNVNMSQAFGGPATYFLQSHDPRHLRAAYRNYDKIRAMYGQVPGGMFGGDENCRPGFHGPRQAIETCGIVEMMLSLETLVAFSGDLLWADRCEDAAFNSLPAAILADFRGLRYLTAPNQVLSDRAPKNPGVQNGGPMFLMSPNMHRCCQHNFGHGWPYFAMHLWYATPDNGLAAVFYNQCAITAQVADAAEVTIRQETHYPFDERVTLRVETTAPVEFPLYLRVPGWCERPTLAINGTAATVASKPDHFLRILRTWQTGDTIQLELPMTVQLRTWKENFHSVSVDRGPLTYSLRIGEKYVRNGGSDTWPDIEIRPTTPWNYGLVLPADDPAGAFQVLRRDWPKSEMPFTLEGTPIELQARGRRIPEWQLEHTGLVAELQESPVWSEQPIEPITLVPMGAARLRVAAFPVIGTGPNAHRWQAPPQPLSYQPTASHCHEGDSVQALCDRRLPKGSNDHGLPRMTWWDHRGTREWVQYAFASPREVRQVAVYWFDDTGRGQCRVPASWTVEYRTADGQWCPVETAAEGGVARDQFNQLPFTPVTTTAMRLSVQLQPDWSGGILEWQLMPE